MRHTRECKKKIEAAAVRREDSIGAQSNNSEEAPRNAVVGLRAESRRDDVDDRAVDSEDAPRSIAIGSKAESTVGTQITDSEDAPRNVVVGSSAESGRNLADEPDGTWTRTTDSEDAPRNTIVGLCAESATNRGSRDPEDAPRSVAVGSSAGTSTEVNICSCGATFSSYKGLQLHRRRKHEDEFFAEQKPVTKARWSRDELELLAKEEAKLVGQGLKLVNENLAKKFPGRSVEAMKGKGE